MSTQSRTCDRRKFLTASLSTAAALGTAALPFTTLPLMGQQPNAINPTPAPRDWSGNSPMMYPDPDILTIDNRRFGKYVIFNTPIQRLHTGTLWAEGPAWNAAGRFMVWSDIPNNVQLRWI